MLSSFSVVVVVPCLWCPPVSLVFSRALGTLQNVVSIMLVRLDAHDVLIPDFRNSSRLSGAMRFVC